MIGLLTSFFRGIGKRGNRAGGFVYKMIVVAGRRGVGREMCTEGVLDLTRYVCSTGSWENPVP